jgi:hypothetical protein
MKVGAALLIWVGVLFVAAPVLADRVPCREFSKGSLAGVSADVVHGFEMNNAIHDRSSELFNGNNGLFSFYLLRDSISGADLRDLASYERFSSHTKRGNRWFDGRGKDLSSQGDERRPTSVPESGTFSLLLLGVTAVGIFARRC